MHRAGCIDIIDSTKRMVMLADRPLLFISYCVEARDGMETKTRRLNAVSEELRGLSGDLIVNVLSSVSNGKFLRI